MFGPTIRHDGKFASGKTVILIHSAIPVVAKFTSKVHHLRMVARWERTITSSTLMSVSNWTACAMRVVQNARLAALWDAATRRSAGNCGATPCQLQVTNRRGRRGWKERTQNSFFRANLRRCHWRRIWPISTGPFNKFGPEAIIDFR